MKGLEREQNASRQTRSTAAAAPLHQRPHPRTEVRGAFCYFLLLCVVVPVTRPFFGTMGVAPPLPMGRISSREPGVHTGNIDNKDITAGTTLYMPVYAPGALFSVGDGHAVQGQG